MDNEIFIKDITKRLDLIIKLLAISSLKDSNLTDKICFLYTSGFSPKEISEILNTTSNYVNVILSNMRKKKKNDVNNENQKAQETNISTMNMEVKNG